MIIDVITIILSAIAIGLSICAILNENKNNRINIKSEYFRELYFKLLLDEIPNTRMQIRFENNKLEGYSNFINSICKLLRKSKYYKYLDAAYYIQLKNLITSLEDFILDTANKNTYPRLQRRFLARLDREIEKIYQHTEKKHMCG